MVVGHDSSAISRRDPSFRPKGSSMRLRTTHLVSVAMLALLASASVQAEVKLGSPFSNGMVLQRDMPVPVWGTAASGEQVVVAFDGQTKTTKAGVDGKWLVKLDAMAASSKGRTLEARGDNTISLSDVLVGEVWLCSGQSNMEMALGGAVNAKQEIAGSSYPLIRLFDVSSHVSSATPNETCPGSWRVCSPKSAPSFSAAGYFFGRRLHKELKVPVGLIGANWSGSRIEPWIPQCGFDTTPELKDIAVKIKQLRPAGAEGKAYSKRYIKQVKEWVQDAERAAEGGEVMPDIPHRLSSRDVEGATRYYCGMIHPLVPYAMRGVIWYQGESNSREGLAYYPKMKALIHGWRSVWGLDLHFYYVQLTTRGGPLVDPAGGRGWAAIREAQSKTLSVPNTGMATITDIGGSLHPANKQDVGGRLAQWALHQTYGRKDLVPSGPLYESHKVEGDRIRIRFKHVGAGLMVGKKTGLAPTKQVRGKLAVFAIAGPDKRWHWADAVIDGETVLVSSEKCPDPVAARYAYVSGTQDANLYNKDGLPASPFRTDDW